MTGVGINRLESGISCRFPEGEFWERAWEPAGEPKGRWFDLARLELVEELPNYQHELENDPFDMSYTKEDHFLPVAEEEIYLNPSLEK